jgi:outer membrane protein
MKKKLGSVMLKALPVALMATFATSASAQKAGDNLINIGVFHIHTIDSSKPVQVTSPVQQTMEGSGSTVGDATTLGIAYTRFLTDNISLTLDGGIPPTFKLDGTGTLEGVGRIGQAKQWSPAVVAKYHFGTASSKFRPSVGLGLTYVWYSDIEVTDKFQQALSGKISNGTYFAGKSKIDLESSLAPVFNIGASYAIDDKWSINGSLSYILLKTKAKIETTMPTGLVKSETKLTVNPLVAFVSVGYKF